MNLTNKIKHVAILVFSFFLLFITANELFITDYQVSLKNKKQNIQGYEYNLRDNQAKTYDKFMAAPNEEAQTFHYMDLIQNSIKSDVTSWIISNIENEIKFYENEGVSYFELLNNQTIWNFIKVIF